MNTSLQLIDLAINLDQTPIARLTATIPAGQVLTVMGPSGSGKSTLLAALTGTLAPAFHATGRILLNARDLTDLAPQQRQIGLMFQDDLLFPHLSVAANLSFALPSSVARPDRPVHIAQALASVDLPGFEQRDPATLSGGQRARVALARCLLSAPRALALDEPFSRLDATLRSHIRTLVFDHARARALPVILVTHDPQDARAANGPVVDTMGQPVSV